MASSVFERIPEHPPDPILGISAAYREDKHVPKVDLGVGSYRTEDGKPYLFQAVRKVQEALLATQTDKEYLPMDGLFELKKPTQILIFGSEPAVTEDRIASAQSLSGTGALRIAADFIKSQLPQCKEVWLSKPTWPNHRNIFVAAGLSIKEYAYWNQATRGLDMESMLRDLRSAPESSVVVLHACAHNPTGVDPTKSQWSSILEVVKERRLLPLFDFAYQGYASGDLERDAYSIRLFRSAGLEMLVAQSFAKNMGLYGERIGMLHVVCSSIQQKICVLSQLRQIIRQTYSSPPGWGANIALRILSNEEYRRSWEAELKGLAARIQRMRTQLRDGLLAKGTPGNWDHITTQIGMFSYTGLSVQQSEALTQKWHIYLLKSGRISMAGLNSSNIDYVVNAIDDVIRHAGPKSNS